MAKPETVPARKTDDKPAVEERTTSRQASFADFFGRSCPFPAKPREAFKATPPNLALSLDLQKADLDQQKAAYAAAGSAGACVNKVVTYAINSAW